MAFFPASCSITSRSIGMFFARICNCRGNISNVRHGWILALLVQFSLHPAVSTTEHVGSSIDNGITIGFTVGDVTSAIAEMRAKNIPILRDVIEHDAGKNAIIQDPDGYLVSFFEPAFKDATQQAGGYHGFTPS